MVDFLAEKRKEIEARLKELSLLVEEHARLERVAVVLERV